jgi:hypothetical protein
MFAIVVNIPPVIENYFTTTPVETMAAHALLAVGWVPIFGLLIWGMTQLWVDFKQNKYAGSLKWVLLDVRVPQASIQTPKGMENFFTNLAGSKSGLTWKEIWLIGKFQAVFSFEIISTEGRIQFLIRTTDKYRDLIEADIYAQYPEAQITEVEDYVGNIAHSYPDSEWDIFGMEFGLKKPSYLPVRTYVDFEHQGEKEGRFKDPLLPILELMGKMGPGENFWIQIIIQAPDEQDWAKDGAKFAAALMGKEEKKKASTWDSVRGTVMALPLELVRQTTGIEGAASGGDEKKSDDFRMFKLTPTEKTQLEGVSQKISKLGWNTKIRVVYAAKKNRFRKGMMASGMKGMMHAYGNSSVNGFAAYGPSVPKDDYFWMEWQYPGKQTRLARRYASRDLGAGGSPIILNTEELATLWHFPGADARTPVLASIGARRAEAPTDLYYADEDGDGLPDWKQKHGATQTPKAPEKDEGYQAALPRPMAPTADQRMEQLRVSAPVENMPQPGLPAPLPPGLDLSDEPLDTDASAPTNLPL